MSVTSSSKSAAELREELAAAHASHRDTVEGHEARVKELEAALAEVDKVRVGLAVNVRYGWFEDNGTGRPELRCDVNTDGAWVIARSRGAYLADMLHYGDDGGPITDVNFINEQPVEVERESELGWRLKRLIPAEEYEGMLDAERAELKAATEVQMVATQSHGEKPVGSRFLDSMGATWEVARGLPPSSDYNFEAVLLTGSEKGRSKKWFGDLGAKFQDPLALDRWGNPIYEGDRVEFTPEDKGADVRVRGVVVKTDDEQCPFAVKRDDGQRGAGPGNTWNLTGSSPGWGHHAVDKLVTKTVTGFAAPDDK